MQSILTNTIVWLSDGSNIDETISELKDLKFELTDEGEVDSFLGTVIDKYDSGNIIMAQKGLIDTIIKSVGLGNNFKQHRQLLTLMISTINLMRHEALDHL